MKKRFIPPLILLLVALSALASASEVTENDSAIDRRIELEWATRDNPFVITPHRPTYVLPVAYNPRINNAPYEDVAPELAAENSEIKFQLSFKVPLVKGLLFGEGTMAFGYTQQSYWQAYNGNYSSPFRETNHEPEILFTYPADFQVMGMRGRLVTLSLNHQSNGRSESLSRSWNRIMLETVLERGNLYMSFKPWWRIPENEDTDDNPDIEDYLGHFEFRALQLYRNHSVGVMLRNNLQEENRGAIQLDYTFPIRNRLNGYVQLFSGYGESLIDYDHYNNRIGIGIMLTNWL